MFFSFNLHVCGVFAWFQGWVGCVWRVWYVCLMCGYVVCMCGVTHNTCGSQKTP